MMGRTDAFLEHADALERGLLDIGRASKASGVSVKMIRHYEAIRLLRKVARTYANYRVYSANDVHTLRFIATATIDPTARSSRTWRKPEGLTLPSW
jgi:hypothetical protein